MNPSFFSFRSTNHESSVIELPIGVRGSPSTLLVFERVSIVCANEGWVMGLESTAHTRRFEERTMSDRTKHACSVIQIDRVALLCCWLLTLESTAHTRRFEEWLAAPRQEAKRERARKKGKGEEEDGV